MRTVRRCFIYTCGCQHHNRFCVRRNLILEQLSGGGYCWRVNDNPVSGRIETLKQAMAWVKKTFSHPGYALTGKGLTHSGGASFC